MLSAAPVLAEGVGGAEDLGGAHGDQITMRFMAQSAAGVVRETREVVPDRASLTCRTYAPDALARPSGGEGRLVEYEVEQAGVERRCDSNGPVRDCSWHNGIGLVAATQRPATPGEQNQFQELMGSLARDWRALAPGLGTFICEAVDEHLGATG